MQCNFCWSSATAFEPWGQNHDVLMELEVIGGGFRPNARCPRCGSLDRERLVILYLRCSGILPGERALSVLHIAPEPCLGRALKRRPNTRYITGDIAFRRAGIQLDVEALPFPAETFDLIICNHVLEHVQRDSAALLEIRRVLSGAGTAILQVPIANRLAQTREGPTVIDKRERERIFGQADHVRLYGTDYSMRLARAGFRIQSFNVANTFDRRLVERYSLIEREMLFVAQKA
jgi:SAM-dependent methyltransferase